MSEGLREPAKITKKQFEPSYVVRCQKCGIGRFPAPTEERAAGMLADNAAWNLQESLGTLGDCCRNNSKVELLVCPECARVPGPLQKGVYEPRLPDKDCSICHRPYRGIP